MFRKKTTGPVADEKEAPINAISPAAPVDAPRVRRAYSLDDFELLATLGTGTFGRKILDGKVDFPKHIESKAKDLIKKLLSQDRTKRLGCLRGGSEDVKKHKYFGKVDWDSVLARSETPPYLPPVGGPGDHTHFDEYPDSPVDDAVILYGEDRAAFEVFDQF
ncbi:hypothetical protein PC118_g5369 [Phytophthora cactorum]|uniref:AGC-kinase C-terminal domain-containing protein n=1 Tax=Phytophthora cactorum TaxID=29920 RepID=A0A8T1G8R3_9STRA|nr:hypothetical protein PC118_g5369 [Phytophthora cactorum]KAG3097134.1 hypothetical protein PC122_g4659 [Phytophthora cactorum]